MDPKKILPKWGLECSDAVSFYSLKGQGQKYTESIIHIDCTPFACHAKRQLAFVGGSGILHTSMQVTGSVVDRTHSFHATQSTELLDFVMRFVFPKEMFDHAIIAGKTIIHEGQNVYHQYPLSDVCKDVDLIGVQEYVRITPESIECPDGFVPYLYVRDEPGFWVVHLRLLPRKPLRYVIKLNFSFYNKAIPEWIRQLLAFTGFQSRLLYRGEKKIAWSKWRALVYRLLPLTAYPLGILQEDEEITVHANCQFQEVSR